jgi:cytochrome c oxidase subunit 3
MTTAVADEQKYIQRGIPVSNGKLAMWLFLVTEIMFFTGLIGTYVVLRMSTPADAWPKPHEVHLNELLGAINTFVLIFSSFTVVMAHSAIVRGDRKKCIRYIAVTFVMGWVFLGIKAYEYTAKFQHGIMPGRMGDNLIDPAFRSLTDRNGDKIDLDLPQYKHLGDPNGPYFKYVSQAGLHPYDPNAARMYKEKIKGRLMEISRPLMDQIKAAEEAATKEKKTFTPEERKAIVEKASEKDRELFTLLARINGEDPGRYNRAISPLEVGVDVNELNHKYPDLELPPFIMYGNLWSSSYFAMTGFHAVHVLGGIVMFGIILLSGLMGGLQPNAWNKSMLELTGLYWHFVDVVWIFLFPLLYLV